MPITYTIDSAQSLVLTMATGVLTSKELLEHKERLVEDPQFRPDMLELSDVRDITGLEVTPEAIRQFVQKDADHAEKLGDHKMAIVVRTDIVFGMARMYEMMTSQNLPGVGVFRDLNEARKWLGLA